MDGLTWFGLIAVTAMLVTYALEDRSAWFVLAFAGACALASVYGFLQGAWPFGVVEGVWTVVALRRFMLRTRRGGHGVIGAKERPVARDRLDERDLDGRRRCGADRIRRRDRAVVLAHPAIAPTVTMNGKLLRQGLD